MGGVPVELHICSQTQAGVENKVADALSRRVTTLITMNTEVIGFKRLREKYDSCPDFEKIYVTLQDDPVREMYSFILQDCYLFIFRKLCIPRTSLRYSLS